MQILTIKDILTIVQIKICLSDIMIFMPQIIINVDTNEFCLFYLIILLDFNVIL